MERTKPTKKERVSTYTEALNRVALAQRLGVTYKGNRDLYEALGYKTDLVYADYLAKYSRQDIAASVIDKPVETTWRGDVCLTVGKEEETELEKVWKTLYDELELKQAFLRVDKLAAIGRYAILLLGFSDATTSAQLAQEVPVGKKKLIYVKPFSEGQATINTYVTDPSNKRFGLPLLYKVKVSTEIELTVHYTRLLHITGKKLESDIFGIPMMQRVYNRLDDLEKITGGSAEMFWRGARPGFQGVVDPDYQMAPDLPEVLQDQMNEYENNLRRLIVNEGVKLESLQTQVSTPEAHVDVQLQMVAAATNIPIRILIGSERGELASTQDQNNWYDYVQVRREEQAAPSIINPFIEACQQQGILPQLPEGDSYEIKWDDLYTTSDKEKADIGKTIAETVKIYASEPAAEMIIPPALFLEYVLGLDQKDIDIILDALSKLPPEDVITPEEQAILDAEAVAEEEVILEEEV